MPKGGEAISKASSKPSKPPKPGWYVVHVRTGQEDRMCDLIKLACQEIDKRAKHPKDCVGLKECFSPRFCAQKKWKGEFVDIERPLLPGYVIADVKNPAMLVQAVGLIRELSRVLAIEETYEPLNEIERTWVESQTKKDDRVVPLSFGYKEGEKLVVTDGPLAGHEAMITKVDRKNGLAHIELHFGAMTMKTEVGIVVMPSGKVQQVVL